MVANVSKAIHASRHATGGADLITPADIGAATTGSVTSAIATAGTNADTKIATQHTTDDGIYERLHSANVKTYGALGDGTTDDTTAVQNAINASIVAPAGVCYFPPGTYLCSPLTIPPGAVLQGVNSQGFSNTPASPTMSTIKLKTGSTGPLISPYDGGATTATYVSIFDLCLNGNNINQPLLTLPDMGGSGTQRNWLVERCYFNPAQTSTTGSGNAVYIGNQNRAVVMRDCIISNYDSVGYNAVGGYNGLYWYGSDGLAERVWVSSFANAGVTYAGGNNSYCQTFHHGGAFWNTTNIVVAGGNVILDSAQFNYGYHDGAYIANGPVTIMNCTFFSNSLTTNNNWNHININGTATQVTLVGNNFTTEDLTVNSNLPKYFIADNGTGTLLQQFGNSQMSAAHYGTAFTNYVPPSPVLAPAGAVETAPRQVLNLQTASVLTSGKLYLVGIYLPAGLRVGHISFCAQSVAAVTPTHWWYGLYDQNRVQLAMTADQTTAGYAAYMPHTLAVANIASGASTIFNTTYSGLYYIGLMMAAATMPTNWGGVVGGSMASVAPIMAGASDTAQTTPPGFPHTAGAITADNSVIHYAYVTP